MWDVQEQDETDLTAIASAPAIKPVQDEGRPGPTTSGDLLKILNRVWALEEQTHSSTSTITTLRADLERACSHAKQLRVEQKTHQKDIENLGKKLADQEAVSIERQEEAVRSAIQSVKDDLEDERQATRKLELFHKRVADELIEVKRSLGETLESLERERNVRESTEDVCYELGREMGKDKAKVEELKRQSAKMREEMEEERKMLQMAEVGREEKLAVARLRLEEKNTTLEKLRGELDEFLHAKKTGDDHDGGTTMEESKNSDMYRSAIGPKRANDARAANLRLIADVSVQQGCLVAGSEDDEDLQSLELNKESFSASAEATRWGLASIESSTGSSPTIESVNLSGIRSGFRRRMFEASITSAESREKGGKWDLQPHSQVD